MRQEMYADDADVLVAPRRAGQTPRYQMQEQAEAELELHVDQYVSRILDLQNHLFLLNQGGPRTARMS
jgi:hypothetical protein